jgi:hypothetical protein
MRSAVPTIGASEMTLIIHPICTMLTPPTLSRSVGDPHQQGAFSP